MPSHLKKMVRARMAETGEGHQAALRWVRAQEHKPAAMPPASPLCPDCKLSALVCLCGDEGETGHDSAECK